MWSHAETPSSSLHFSLSVSHTVLLIKELFPVVSPTLWLVEKRWKSHQCVWDMAFSEGPQGRRSHNKVCSVNVNFCFSVKLCFICQTQSKDRHSSSHTGNRGIFSKRNFFLHAFTQQIFSCIITNTVQVVQPQPTGHTDTRRACMRSPQQFLTCCWIASPSAIQNNLKRH